jgi:hypothetical protein
LCRPREARGSFLALNRANAGCKPLELRLAAGCVMRKETGFRDINRASLEIFVQTV